MHLASAQFYKTYTTQSTNREGEGGEGRDEDETHLQSLIQGLNDRKVTKQSWSAKILGRWAFSKKETPAMAKVVVKRLIEFVALEVSEGLFFEALNVMVCDGLRTGSFFLSFYSFT